MRRHRVVREPAAARASRKTGLHQPLKIVPGDLVIRNPSKPPDDFRFKPCPAAPPPFLRIVRAGMRSLKSRALPLRSGLLAFNRTPFRQQKVRVRPSSLVTTHRLPPSASWEETVLWPFSFAPMMTFMPSSRNYRIHTSFRGSVDHYSTVTIGVYLNSVLTRAKIAKPAINQSGRLYLR